MLLPTSLLLACAHGGGEDTGADDPPVEEAPTDTGEACPGPYGALFDEVWDVFQAEYPYFELKGVDWHALRDACRPDMCEEDASYRNFLRRGMDCLLAPLADAHVYVVDTDGQTYSYGVDGYTSNSRASVADAYLDGGGATFGNVAGVTAGLVTGTDVLYVRVDTWSDVGDVDFGEVLALAPDAVGFVVDVRGNSGGDENVAQRLAGRLVGGGDSPYAWQQYRDERDGDPTTYEMTEPAAATISDTYADLAVDPRPIALLVGNKCMSSCEGFVAMMVNSPLTRTFGATTRGATANPAQTTLTDGTIVSVSQWYRTKADGVSPIEWNGFAPDEPVDFSGDGGVDEVLEAGLAWLAAR